MTSKHKKRLATYFLIGLALIQLIRCDSESRKIMIGKWHSIYLKSNTIREFLISEKFGEIMLWRNYYGYYQ